MVYVDAKHFANERESKSLSSKNARPWKIIKNIANKAYKLEIPQQIKDASLILVFYPWKLYLALSDAFSDQVLKSGLAILVNSNDKAHKEWKVLEVVNFCQTRRYGIQ